MKNKTLLLITFFVFCFSIQNIFAQNKAQMSAQKMGTLLYLIENFYTDTVNLDKVTEDAIVAALKELDPHSAYISKKDVEVGGQLRRHRRDFPADSRHHHRHRSRAWRSFRESRHHGWRPVHQD